MARTMLAALLTGPRTIAVHEVPVPSPTEGEVLVEVRRCGICGSDLHAYERGAMGGDAAPRIAGGHELGGTIADIGPGVSGLALGQAVAIEPLASCGQCDLCRTGLVQLCPRRRFFSRGLAQYVAVPATTLHPLPPDMPWAAAALAEPLAVALHAARTGGVRWPQRVLVVGAGSIGLLTLLAARTLGAAFVGIVAKYDHQAALAERLGADRVFRTGEGDVRAHVRSALGDVGPDIVIETVGTGQSVMDSIAVVRQGGTVVLVGLGSAIELPLGALVTREVHLMGAIFYGRPVPGGPSDFALALQLLAAGQVPVEQLVTHTFPLTEAAEAFRTAADKRSGSIKVHIAPS